MRGSDFDFWTAQPWFGLHCETPLHGCQALRCHRRSSQRRYLWLFLSLLTAFQSRASWIIEPCERHRPGSILKPRRNVISSFLPHRLIWFDCLHQRHALPKEYITRWINMWEIMCRAKDIKINGNFLLVAVLIASWFNGAKNKTWSGGRMSHQRLIEVGLKPAQLGWNMSLQ